MGILLPDVALMASGPSTGLGARPSGAPYVRRTLVAFLAMIAFAAFMGSGIVFCPFAVLLRIPCPGCGSTRSIHALLHFDIAGALRFNPVAPLAVLLLGSIALRALVLIYREGHARRIDEGRFGRTLIVLFAAAWILEFVVWGARFFGFMGGPCPLDILALG